MMRHQVDFVYFDAGWTLLKVDPSAGWHYAELARRHGVIADAAALDAAFVSAWRHCRKHTPAHPGVVYGITRDQALAFWSAVIRETFRQAGFQPPAAPSYYMEVFDHFAGAQCWQLFADVEEAFAILEAAGVPFGILSNWDGRLRQTVGELGLGSRVHSLIISSEVEAEKPDRRIFAAAERAASGFSRFGLIGDEPTADGEGALASGWSQCLVWRNSGDPPAGFRSAPTLPAAVRELLFGPTIR